MELAIHRNNLAALTQTGIVLPGLPTNFTHSFSGNVLTLNLQRSHTASTITETIDFSGIGSGTGLTAEQVRDTTADFITPVFPLGKEHDDAGDKLYLTINQQFENVPALMVFTHTGNAILIDRADASRSRTVGDTISNFSSAADVQYHPPSKRVYMVSVTGEIYRTAPGELDSFTQVSSGSIPITSGDNCRGITWHEEDDQWYVASEISLWEADIDTPANSTSAGNWSSLGTARAHAGLTYLNGNIYTIEQAAPRRLLRVNTSNPQNSASVGTVQNVGGGRYDNAAASGGAIYAAWLQGGSHRLHIVPLANPGSPIVLGNIRGLGTAALGGMTAVDIELTTELIPERGNLYFTNARWDDRLEDVVNPGGSLDDSLDTLDVDGDVYAVRNLFTVNDEGDLPTPGEHQVGQGYYILQDKTLRIGVNRPHTQSSPSGTFNAITSRSDLHIVTSLPTDQNALTDGHYYYLNHGSQSGWYRVEVRFGVKELVQVPASSALADSRTSSSQNVEWLGAEATSTDALRFTYSVSSSTDYFFLDTSDNTIKILDQSTFNGTVGRTNHYSFEQLPTGGGASTFLDLTDTPGSYGNAGQYVKLNASADELEFASIPSFESWAADGNTDRIPTSKLGTGTAGSTNYLRGDGVWASINFISQTTADGRYARLATANTFTARQTIDVDGEGLIVDARGYTGNSPAFGVRVGASGDQKAFQLHKGTDNFAWGSFEFNIGGSDKPGLAFGPGGSSSRDTNLYRDEANVLKTDDTFDADAFRQDGDALNFTHLAGTVQSDQLLTDNTLEFDSDTLGVAVHHVIEKLQEHIRHTASSVSYSTKGATVGHVYNTGPYDYRVTHVRVNMDAPATGITCRARIYTLVDNSNEIDEKIADSASREFSERGEFHYLYFSHDGVIVPSNRRVLVCISRTDQSNDSAVFLSVGSEASDSPEKSYNSTRTLTGSVSDGRSMSIASPHRAMVPAPTIPPALRMCTETWKSTTRCQSITALCSVTG